MLEIYSECVQDLMCHPKWRPKGGLKIREEKGWGVYVDQLSAIPVSSYEDIEDKIKIGNQNWTIGATNMNATSSWAHTVTQIRFVQTTYGNDGKPQNSKKSDINLVDLAGSERSKSTGASGQRATEGSNINKSLSFLGRVISVLAEKAQGKGKNKQVPYWESKLTRIL